MFLNMQDNTFRWLAVFHSLYRARLRHVLISVQVQYDQRSLWNCGLSTAKKIDAAYPGSCTFVPSGTGVQKALRLSRSPNEAPWEAAALIAFLIVMRTLVYLALRWKTKSTVR